MATKAMASNTTAYAAIVKFDEQEDGTVLAYGKATDATLDADEQICDPEWLKRAMPEWFKYGNIREQHSSIAAGVATEYEETEDGHYITAHIVDPSSAKKIKTGVLKGFSIGIRRPRVIKDNKAAGGRIVDGQIVEISIVDRPANPSCVLTVAKASKGELKAVKSVFTELNKSDQPRDEGGRFASFDGHSSGEASVQAEMARLENLKPSSGENRFGTREDVNWGIIGEAAEAHYADAEGIMTDANFERSEAIELGSPDLPRIEEGISSMKDGMQDLESSMKENSTADSAYFHERASGSFADASQSFLQAGRPDIAGYARTLAQETKDTAMEIERITSAKSISKGDSDQPRDENGRFASGGGDSGGSEDSDSGDGSISADHNNVANTAYDDIRMVDDNIQGLRGLSDKDERITAEASNLLDKSSQYFEEATGNSANLKEWNQSVDGGIRYADRAADLLLAAENETLVAQGAVLVDFSNNLTNDVVSLTTGLKSISTKENMMKADAILEMSKEWAGSDVVKFDQAAFDNARRALATLIQVEAGEMAEGHSEANSLTTLLSAVHALMEYNEGEAVEGETMLMPEIEMADKPEKPMAEEEMCAECEKSMKECTCETGKCLECGCNQPDKNHGRDDVTTAVVVSDKSQVSDIKTMVEDIVKELLTNPSVGEEITTKATESERIEALETELAQVKSLAAPSGPKRFAAVSNTTQPNLNKAKAAIYRAKAASTLDKSLANGYLALAIDLEKSDS